ncbi:MAG: beta strand repeat-containing protein, partial [Dongiaceae bacterium]
MATFTGTLGNDTLVGTTGADTLIGLTGNDTYTVNHCDDVVEENPGAGIDTVNSSVTFVLDTNVENLTLTGTVAIDGTGNIDNNKLIGNGADNRITTGLGNDTVSSGGGNDVLVLGTALTNLDRIDGGIGTDRLILDGSYNLALNAATVINVEAFQLIDGHSYNLTLNDATNAAGLTVDGSALTGANALVLNGAAETTAALTAFGGAGNDSIVGGAGKDTISGGAGGDSLTGGAGIDTVSYAGSLSGVTVDLTNNSNNTTGDAAGDTLAGFENVIGSDFDDSIKADGFNNSVAGGAGDDALFAGAGIDTLLGGDGNDTLDLAGNLTTADRVDGGDGSDTLKLSGASYAAGFSFGSLITGIENITVAAGNSYKLTLSNATNNGGLVVNASALVDPGNNLILNGAPELESALTAIGGAGNDSVSAGAGADTLSGGAGSDTLLAGAGSDVFDMGAGLNALDRIDGGAGTDTLLLDGNYLGGVLLGATTVTNVETFVFAAGNDYNLTLNAATNSVGLKIDGSALGAGDNLTIDGSLETISAFTFIGGAGSDSFKGGAGKDTLTGGSGSDTLTGGAGIDTVTYASAGAVIVDLATNANGLDAAGDKLSGIETIIGSDFSDSISGDALANTIMGGQGGDMLGGGTGGVAGGLDTLLGEDGADTFRMFGALTALD